MFFSHGNVNYIYLTLLPSIHLVYIIYSVYVYIYANTFFPYIAGWASLTIVGGEREMENPECSWSWVITECLEQGTIYRSIPVPLWLLIRMLLGDSKSLTLWLLLELFSLTKKKYIAY